MSIPHLEIAIADGGPATSQEILRALLLSNHRIEQLLREMTSRSPTTSPPIEAESGSSSTTPTAPPTPSRTKRSTSSSRTAGRPRKRQSKG